ncbi:MAG TPA: tRNA lysidine(34) synthetase TilS [Mariprofundaceae bacterium]|nr:tRNA lysidine(34) synthetase TilS [Mariprofundaceae bacterium]
MTFPYAGFGQTWLEHHSSKSLPRRLAVAWSGGADSTALLLALKAAGYQVSAWHIDHAWRENSAKQAKELAGVAHAWGIPFVSCRLQLSSSSNLEATSRHARYAQFAVWAEEYGLDCLCLGHQMDDQAETVCMRLLQGAGPGGCRGISRERQLGSLHIVRPLLHVPGQELRQALEDIGVAWLEDPTNQDSRFRRNFVRHRLFHAMRETKVSPESLFLRWQKQAEILTGRLDAEADAMIAAAAGEELLAQPGLVRVGWQDWLQTTQPVRARALQKMMAMLLGQGVTPGRRHIMLAEAWTQHSGLGGLDLSRCRLQRRSRFLHLEVMHAGLRG